jgi:uncharacterized protein involved in response to NO
MNPYYATAFITALYFWIWPVFIYQTLVAGQLTAALFAALIMFGAGSAATTFHARFIAPQASPAARRWRTMAACVVIVLLGYLTRAAYQTLSAA